jgi:Family of unknown function (DUF5313)
MTPPERQPQSTSVDGTPDGQRRRPGPLRGIWYAFGGALGPRYRQWVLRDLTCPTRWERQLVRAVVQVAPLAALVLVALGDNRIAWVGVGRSSTATHQAPPSGSATSVTTLPIRIGCAATCRPTAPT